MKRAFIYWLILMAIVPSVRAMWASVPLDELLKKSDAVVIARLTDVSEGTENGRGWILLITIVLAAMTAFALFLSFRRPPEGSTVFPWLAKSLAWRRRIYGMACLAALIAVVYAEENWRRKPQYDDYASGTLTVVEVLSGTAQRGAKLRLEWLNPSGIVCPRVEHKRNEGPELIWLLNTFANGTVSANYPGRVLSLEARKEIEALLAYEAKRRQMLATAVEADFGPPPPFNHQEIETQMVRASMKNPDTAKIEFESVTRDTIQSELASPTPVLVWRSRLRVDGKDDNGYDMRSRPYEFAWQNGRVIAMAKPQGGSGRCGAWQYLK